jgi:peptidoglycan/LPS O-acetylase OafA/YrhL
MNLAFHWVANPFRFDLQYDAILVGCLLAFLRSDPKTLAFLRRKWFQSWLIPVGFITAFVVLNQDHMPGILFTLRQTLLIVGVALLISYSVDVPTSITGKLLSSRPLVWLGALSYSLYVWQQLFCWRHEVHDEFLPSLGLQHFPLNAILSLSMATLSYYGIETPFNRLKRYVPRSRTSRALV